ncbi:MAG TPA: DUF5127 domain-containing protein [Solirubrobacteraceae bacterium]|nr:DUF5127 domain-containing protein [Solirubrobacteraceae bacterium]
MRNRPPREPDPTITAADAPPPDIATADPARPDIAAADAPPDTATAAGPPSDTDAHDSTAPPADTSGLDRRRFLQAGTAMAALGGGLAAASSASAAESVTARALRPRPGHGSSPKLARPGTGAPTGVPAGLATTPIRPPATPLVVRSPYLSTWQAATVLPGTWETFWGGGVTALAGIARVDGASYEFSGSPTIVLDVPNGGYGQQTTINDFEAALNQTKLQVTATRSIYTLQGGGVELTMQFLSPVEPGDLRRQSIPMAYVFVSARSVDGAAHDVSIYLDISGEWLSADSNAQFTWAPATVPYSGGTLQVWTMELANQQPLVETSDRAQWGTIVWATPQVPGLSWQSGSSPAVRAQFVEGGKLLDVNDTSYTSINGDGYPVFAFALQLGSVSGRAQRRQFSLGQVRTPLVSFLGKPLQPLWTQHFSSWQAMLAFFHGDASGAAKRAARLDARVAADARAAGGRDYEGLCVLALRQAYGATELAVGPDDTPWAFLKEISSDGDTSTVDVIYPAAPVWVYLDPQYLALLLKPIFAYAASGKFTEPYAPHDLGPYPNASGYAPGKEEAMPVEESGNMIIMAAAYALADPGADSAAYLKANYALLKRWANYLISVLPDPGFQNQTDDFAGFIAHSVNLALKGIIAVAAMGQIASTLGETSDATRFTSKAHSFIATWLQRSQDPSGAHLDLTYNGAGDGDGSWGTTYNAYADALLGTDLVPASIAAEQAAFYPTVMNMFGLPLQVPHSYAKSDWEMWTAAWLRDHPVCGELIAREYLYANTTSSRVPFSDLYSTISGDRVGFEARPVQGGIYALLALRTTEKERARVARRTGRAGSASTA